jgi:hypothetical protein
LTQDIQSTIIKNIRSGKFFVGGETRDGYVEPSGDSIVYVYTNNISVYVPLTQLPDDAESLNEGVLDTIKDQVKDSSLVGPHWSDFMQEAEHGFYYSRELRDELTILGSAEIAHPSTSGYRLALRNSKGFIEDEDDNPCFHYSVKLSAKDV